MLSVESLISSNFPGFENQTRYLRQPILGFFRYLFHEIKMQRFKAKNPHLVGIYFVEQVLEYLTLNTWQTTKTKYKFQLRAKWLLLPIIPLAAWMVWH